MKIQCLFYSDTVEMHFYIMVYRGKYDIPVTPGHILIKEYF